MSRADPGRPGVGRWKLQFVFRWNIICSRTNVRAVGKHYKIGAYCVIGRRLPAARRKGLAGLTVAGRVWGMNKPRGLYANINARKRAGTSRPKSRSTVSPKVWKAMKSKTGGFKPS